MVPEGDLTRVVLVTGARGQVGRALAAALEGSARGILLGREELDVTDPARVGEALDLYRPEAIFHAAAFTDVDGAEREPGMAKALNAEACASLAGMCQRRGILLVAVSTDYVFDGEIDRPYREDDPPNPLSVYGRTKLLGEEAVRASRCEHLIVRGQGIYGEGRRHLVRKLLDSEDPEAEFAMAEDRVSQPTFARDFADALVALWQRGARGTFHVANRGPLSWYRFALLVQSIAGRPRGRIVPVKAAERGETARRPAFSALDVSRYEAAIGTRMRTVQEALRAFLAGVTAP